MKKYCFQQYTNGDFITQRIVSQSSFDFSIHQIFQISKNNSPSAYVSSLLQDGKLIIKVEDTPSTELFQEHKWIISIV